MKLSILNRPVLAVPFLFVLMVNGCGTIVTLQEDSEFDCRTNLIYSGTIRTVENVGHTWPDIPFSFVVDTIVLPYTVPKTIWNYFHPRTRDGDPLGATECLNEGYKHGPNKPPPGQE
jgi:uncharacterized protein YceK